MRADKFRLLFFGSDPFSVRVLDHLLGKQICPTEVVTKPHTILDRFAATKRLRRYAWPSDLQPDSVIRDSHNIGLVASFGSLIDEPTVKRFSHGLFNVHPSLLPKYRGSTPIQAAVFDGIKETGCTIMQIPPVLKFDIGDIVLQERMAIKPGEYAIDLRDRLADLGAQMAEKLLADYDHCIKQTVAQDSTQKSLSRKLKPEQACLKFKTDSLDLIERKVRAYTGFLRLHINCLNGLKVELDGMEEPKLVERYELDRLVSGSMISHVSDRKEPSVIMGASGQPAHQQHVAAGTMFLHKVRRQLCLKTADNKWAAFEWATPEWKAKMSALDFYNGYLSKVSQPLRVTDV